LLIRDRNVNRYRKRQLIYAEGNHPSKLFYILKGKVKTFKTSPDGKDLVMDLYKAGDFLGHIALLEKSTYRENAEAMEETELAIIPKTDFEEIMQHSPALSQRFIQLLACNVSEKEQHLLNIAYSSLRKKVAEALMIILRKYAQQEASEAFVIDITRENLAAIAGTATESLIRTLGDFKNERLVEINNGIITIRDKKKLQQLTLS
ncbi:MAG: Crp/Fnr family transcriptional regulator, partial [Chitinophagaceae bacterium]